MKQIRFVSTGILLFLLGTIGPIQANQQDQNQQQDKAKQQEDQNKGQQQKAQQQQQDQNKQQQQKAQQNQQQQQDQNKQQQHAQQQQQDQSKQQQQKAQQNQQQQQQHAQQQQQDQNKQQQQKAQQNQQQQQQHAQQQQQANRSSQQVEHVQQSQRSQVWQQHRAQNWQSEHRTWQQRGGYNGYRIPDDRFQIYFGPSHGFRIHSFPMEVYGGYPRFQYQGFWFGFMDPWPEYWSNDWYDNDDVYVVYTEDGYYLYNRRYPQDRVAIEVYLN
jgi:hypothetical protein